MPARLLEGRPVAEAMEAEVRTHARRFREARGRAPFLSVFLVGDDPASAVYVRNKTKSCEMNGVGSETVRLPASTDRLELLAQIAERNANPAVDAILVQLPLPAGTDTGEVLLAVDPAKDVDGFHPRNVGALALGEALVAPCTPAGILAMLRFYGIDVEGKRAVILGRSRIVGLPLFHLLLRAHATVTVCHTRTRDLPSVTREAELLFVAAGRAGFVTADYVAEGAVVVDVGTNRLTDAATVHRLWGGTPREATFREKGAILVGDVDFRSVVEKASAITPIPGGVGPLTIAMLLRNTVTLAEARKP